MKKKVILKAHTPYIMELKEKANNVYATTTTMSEFEYPAELPKFR